MHCSLYVLLIQILCDGILLFGLLVPRYLMDFLLFILFMAFFMLLLQFMDFFDFLFLFYKMCEGFVEKSSESLSWVIFFSSNLNKVEELFINFELNYFLFLKKYFVECCFLLMELVYCQNYSLNLKLFDLFFTFYILNQLILRILLLIIIFIHYLSQEVRNYLRHEFQEQHLLFLISMVFDLNYIMN